MVADPEANLTQSVFLVKAVQVPDEEPRGKYPGLHIMHLTLAASSSAKSSVVANKQSDVEKATQFTVSAAIAFRK